MKTSLSLSRDLVAKLDRMAGPNVSRSAFVERIIAEYIDSRAQERRLAREVAAINRHAAELNAEMQDVLSLQADIADE